MQSGFLMLGRLTLLASLHSPMAGLLCLHRGLASGHAHVRARSFDILFNVAVHAELLSTSEAANVAEQIEVRGSRLSSISRHAEGQPSPR